MEFEDLTEEQKVAYAFALDDIRNGHTTLWVNRLRGFPRDV